MPIRPGSASRSLSRAPLTADRRGATDGCGSGGCCHGGQRDSVPQIVTGLVLGRPATASTQLSPGHQHTAGDQTMMIVWL
jgi:hypothetical protein